MDIFTVEWYNGRMSHEETVRQLVEILRPLKGTGTPLFEDDEYPDRVGPDAPIRAAVSDALKELQLEGLGGCLLCCG
jgi:hypothetical protein